MSKTFYLDESGNTGDLVVSEDNINFGSQDYFTLACIGLDNSSLDQLNAYIKVLKSKYKIQSAELKFSKMKNIFGNKMGFVLELLKFIEEHANFIFEFSNKKYIICTNIASCLINTPYEQDDLELDDIIKIHQESSQWVYNNVTNDFLAKFTYLARNPSEVGVNELFSDILELAEASNDQYSKIVIKNIENSKTIFTKFKVIQKLREMRKSNEKCIEKEAFKFFLPIPDLNKRGKNIGILPYISSFTNIHARLNQLNNRDLSKVKLVHDNQSHFDEILMSYHDNAVKNTTEKSLKFEHADFNFSNISSLEFSDDKDYIGVQIADLFAGFVNKAIPYILAKEQTLSDREEKLLLRILASLYFNKSINFVIPKEQRTELFRILDSKANELIAMCFNGGNIDQYDSNLLNTDSNTAPYV